MGSTTKESHATPLIISPNITASRGAANSESPDPSDRLITVHANSGEKCSFGEKKPFLSNSECENQIAQMSPFHVVVKGDTGEVVGRGYDEPLWLLCYKLSRTWWSCCSQSTGAALNEGSDFEIVISVVT